MIHVCVRAHVFKHAHVYVIYVYVHMCLSMHVHMCVFAPRVEVSASLCLVFSDKGSGPETH